MIYVTQGHEKGIGLEIFLKSFMLLSSHQKSQIVLVVSPKDLNETLALLKIPKESLIGLNVLEIKSNNLPPSTASLDLALKTIQNQDILVTLPTSKDQIILNGCKMAGYTEFFREHYKNPTISMTFKGIEQNVLLITDHLPLVQVPNAITKDLIVQKTLMTMDFYKKYFGPFEEIIFSGINPHVGENGLLGCEDVVLQQALTCLEQKDPKTSFLGPYSGDTLHMHQKDNKKQLFVYMYHDQGLAQFKAKHGLIGLNISMGLPFLRLSVDHGTAFELYGKNKANISSMMFLFKSAFEVIDYVNKRN